MIIPPVFCIFKNDFVCLNLSFRPMSLSCSHLTVLRPRKPAPAVDTLRVTESVQPAAATVQLSPLLNSAWQRLPGRPECSSPSGRGSGGRMDTYQHSPPGNTGRSPRTFRGSQVGRGRKSGIRGDAL